MKKKFLSLALAIMMAISSLALFTACDEEWDVEINEDQTQLFIGIYDGGFGHEWLQKLADEFEELYKDKSFEDGKQGVQIIIDPKKTEYQSTQLQASISTGINDMYFSTVEVVNFVRDDLLLDVTDAVTTPLTEYGDNRSIADKLNPIIKEYTLGVTASKNKYYSIPNYIAFPNITYDVDFFEEKKLFFDSNGNWTSGKGTDNSKSVGQDGKANTYDDGLPVTWNDYKKLIAQIKLFGTPFIWNGAYNWYRLDILTALWANYEGANNFSLNIDFNGTDSNLGPINGTNGYLLQKQEGKRHALVFAEHIMKDENNYAASSFGSSTHMAAQDEFLYSKKKANEGSAKRIAMLWEGNWWENEAKNTIVGMAESDSSYANRRFGIMPFPQMDDNANKNYVMYALSPNASVVIRKNAEQPELAKMFMRYTSTDEALRLYTRETGAIRDMDYKLTDDDLSQMSYYKQKIWELYSAEKTTVVYTNDTSSFSQAHPSFLRGAWSFGAEYDGKVLGCPMEAFKLYAKEGLTADVYFNKMAETFDKEQWDSTYKF